MPTPTPILTPRSEDEVTGGLVGVDVAAAATLEDAVVPVEVWEADEEEAEPEDVGDEVVVIRVDVGLLVVIALLLMV